jgi:hypothetical protein
MAREDLAEVAAMAVATDKGSFEAARMASKALDLDGATKAALGAQLSLEPERWRERFMDLAIDAVVDAQSREDPQLVLEPMSGHAWILAKRQRFDELFETHGVLLSRLSTHDQARMYKVTPDLVTSALFPPKVVSELCRAASAENTSSVLRRNILIGLTKVLEHSASLSVVELLRTANELASQPTDEAAHMVEMLVAHAESHTAGQEAEIVAVLDSLAPLLAQRMLTALTAAGTPRTPGTATRSPAAIAILKPLLKSHHPTLRCEATALLSESPDALGRQLTHYLGSTDAALRSAALSTMMTHQVRSAGPGLVGVIEAESFKQRTPEEQEQMLDTLYALNPSRSEPLLIKLVEQHGMLADQRLEKVRIAAARVLGRRGDSNNPLDALESAARRRPWNTEALRMAAGAAAEAIMERLRNPGGTNPSNAPGPMMSRPPGAAGGLSSGGQGNG